MKDIYLMTIQEMTVTELERRIEQQGSLFLLDVREPNEVAVCSIANATHIAMNLVPIYLDQIPDEVDIIIYCHHGVRSLAVAHYLIENGFDSERVYSVAGGIDAWALKVETTMVRY